MTTKEAVEAKNVINKKYGFNKTDKQLRAEKEEKRELVNILRLIIDGYAIDKGILGRDIATARTLIQKAEATP